MAVVPQPARRRTTIVVLLLLSVTVLTFDIRGNGIIDGARRTARDVMAPVEWVGRTAFSPFENTWHAIFDYERLKKENERLRADMAEARGQVASAQKAIIENRDLRELLDLATNVYVGAYPSIAAEVANPGPSNFDHAIEIDQGSNKGIKVGMAVVTPEGVVGRVTKVAPNRSVVRLIDDPELYVGVKITSTENITIEQGTAFGRGQGEPLGVENIDNDADLKPGDPVYTSGGDAKSLFPPDLPVGEVLEATKDASGAEQTVRVQPNAALDDLAFVRVILWVPPQ